MHRDGRCLGKVDIQHLDDRVHQHTDGDIFDLQYDNAGRSGFLGRRFSHTHTQVDDRDDHTAEIDDALDIARYHRERTNHVGRDDLNDPVRADAEGNGIGNKG